MSVPSNDGTLLLAIVETLLHDDAPESQTLDPPSDTVFVRHYAVSWG